jgi:hypothetical protein
MPIHEEQIALRGLGSGKTCMDMSGAFLFPDLTGLTDPQ